MATLVTILRRFAASLPIVALALPVVIVEDCATHKRETLAGWQLLLNGGWVVLVPAMVYAVFRIVRPALPGTEVLTDRIRAVGTWALEALLGGGSLFVPLMVALFDKIEYQIGFWVEAAGWGTLWLTAAANAAKALHGFPVSPPRTASGWLVTTWLYAAAVVVVLGPAFYSLAEGEFEPTALLAGAVVGLPVAIWGFSLSRALHLKWPRRIVGALMVLAAPLLVDSMSDPIVGSAAMVSLVFTAVAFVGLWPHSTVTTDH